ncbi:ABC transporter ATP-binding protein, partial [Candidatus Hydrogenedentota bacterium]
VIFEVEPGQSVGFVGPTGSGKSTIVALLSRFYDVTSGRILFDGTDIREIKPQSLRKNIGIVFQDTFLFSCSIGENIAYGRPEADKESIAKAARAAKAHDFVEETENGYETVIGERGTTLSGGQKQRVAIARALLTAPRILVLDDSTASVDSNTERQIQEALVEVSKGRTTFVITQRVSTVRHADKIVVLDEGRVVEEGKHDELIAAGGLYAEICASQVLEGPGFLAERQET